MLEIRYSKGKQDMCEGLMLFSDGENFPNELNSKQVEELKMLDFKGEGCIFLSESKIFVVGIKIDDLAIGLRDCIAQAIRVAQKIKIKDIKVVLPNVCKCATIKDSRTKNEDEHTLMQKILKEFCEGVWLGEYVYEEYKTKKLQSTLKSLVLCTPLLSIKEVESIIAESKIICENVNWVRSLVNTPPKDATPEFLAQQGRNIAKQFGMTCKVYDEKYLKEEGMEAFLAVSLASVHKPRLIHLTYKPKKTKKPLKRVVLVGKGLTYDSGGLSLKPSDYMVSMKADKSGGSAVLGILRAVAQLNLNVEVHGIVGATENMIGGNAYKPDDVLVARNKKTIEVRNTDAEGRLVLADCLSYACDLKPDYLIDLATLTGACVVGLGEYTMGIMGNNQELKDNFRQIVHNSGELGAELPFNPYIKKLIKSEIADLCNIPSSRYGGAVSAGMFLSEFVEKDYQDKWLHLDIAGPAYVEKAWGSNVYGATGAGVRSVLAFLKEQES